MEILTDIIEVSNSIIGTLEENDFFKENIFVGKRELKRKIQERMQRKWEQENEMLLTDKEFIEICNEVSGEAIGETLGTLVDKGALDMGVDENGEIYYSANPDFEIKNLNNDRK